MAVENSFLDYINSAANSVNSEEASLTRKIAEPESNNALNAAAVPLNGIA
jgi:hypothetical protein